MGAALANALALVGALGPVAGGSALAAVVAALASIVVGSRTRSPAMRVALSAIPVVAAAVALGACALAIGDLRGELTESLVHAGGHADPGRVARLASAQLDVPAFGAAAGMGLVPLVALGAAWPWIVPRGTVLAQRGCVALVALAGAAPLVVALGAIGEHARRVIIGFGAVANADAESKQRALAEVFVEAGAALANARPLIVLSAAALGVAAVIVAALVGRRGGRVGIGPAIAGGLLLAAGVASFALTRPLAQDVRSRVAFPSVGPEVPPTPHALELSAGECGEQARMSVPVLAIGSAVTLDGRPMPESEQVTSDLETLNRNWSLLHPGGGSMPGVQVSADGREPFARLVPWLRATEAARITHAWILTRTVVRVPTASLGALSFPSACAVAFALGSGASSVPASSIRDAEDLMRRARAARLVVDLAR